MGLVSQVLLLPLAPVRGVSWIAERLQEAAEEELHSPAAIRAQLRALNLAYEDEEIGAAEFEREEERLLDLLEGRSAAQAAGVPDRFIVPARGAHGEVHR